MKDIVTSKFNNIDIDFVIHEGDKMCNLCIYDKCNRILYYQTYKIVYEYCNDILFKPIKNEFNDELLFTNEELKQIFEIQDNNNNNSYYLENLYDSCMKI